MTRFPHFIAALAIVGIYVLVISVFYYVKDVESIKQGDYDLPLHTNLHRLGLAISEFENAHKCFPTRCIRDKNGNALLSWRVSLLPYLGENTLYDAFRRDEKWDSPHNIKLISSMPKVFAHPSLTGQAADGLTLFVAVPGDSALFGEDKCVTVDSLIRFQRLDDTIAVVESSKPVPWTKPVDLECNRDSIANELGYRKPMGFYALFADCHVEFVSFSDVRVRPRPVQK